ncbi:MAG: hypothetical protein EOM50_22600 [Erysipelotrichia bacterium]|nr:hypothetical protein [Erysipelotrichia bacterium]
MSLLSIKKKLSCNRRLFYDCLLAGLLTCLVFIALSIVLKVYPFGDNTFLYSDSDQNISFVSYFANSFTSNNNLLYSWSGAFGGSVICTIAYYTSSPFNLFMLLFQNNFLLGYYFSTITGFIFAAINFCLCIEYIHHGKKRIGIICFSVCYAFIGYTVTYIWSTPWMVGVAFLPLMMLGLLKIINENKSGIFVISSTLSLVGNFYTGYMNLLAVCIFFVGLMFTQRGLKTKSLNIMRDILF